MTAPDSGVTATSSSTAPCSHRKGSAVSQEASFQRVELAYNSRQFSSVKPFGWVGKGGAMRMDLAKTHRSPPFCHFRWGWQKSVIPLPMVRPTYLVFVPILRKAYRRPIFRGPNILVMAV